MKRLLMIGVLVVAGSAVFAVVLANTLVELLSGDDPPQQETELYGG